MNRSLIILLLLAAPALGADKGIKFPDPPSPAPAPTPAPSPTTPITLNKGQIYVVTSDSPFMLIGSRDGLVKVCALKLPVTIYGEFVDPKPGDDNGRTYTTGAAFVVKPVASGEVELIASPDLTGTNLTRRIVQCNVAPLPPPVPVPPPTPVPPADPFQAVLQAAYLADTDTDKAASIADLNRVFGMAAIGAKSPGFTSLQGILTWMKGSETIAATAIPKTRAAINAELNKVLPKPSADPLTDDVRNLLATEFARIATALGNLKAGK